MAARNFTQNHPRRHDRRFSGLMVAVVNPHATFRRLGPFLLKCSVHASAKSVRWGDEKEIGMSSQKKQQREGQVRLDGQVGKGAKKAKAVQR